MLRGSLWKWTNYWNGWQLRWFILDKGGTLSYFKSQEEENDGCKGSVNISSCEIRVHPTDLLRLDISISGEQHIYLRANSEKERQGWLVALGSVKACVRNSKRSRLTSESCITTKKSELRLYCDLLMQQVHSIKSTIHQDQEIDIEKLSSSSNLLVETCDIFIKTLDDTMTLTESSCNIITGIPHHKDSSGHSPRGSQRNSVSSMNLSDGRSASESLDESPHEKNGVRQRNLFQEVELSPSNQVPTKAFLKSSESVIGICDYLNETAFKPLKEDLLGHVSSLWHTYRSDPLSHRYIQNMILEEVKARGSWESSMQGQSLHHLIRGLMFIHNFLRDLVESEMSTEDSLKTAFEATLLDYRSGQMKPVLENLLRDCPSREEFLTSLGLPKELPQRPQGSETLPPPNLFLNLAKYLDSMEKCLMVLVQFCESCIHQEALKKL